MSGSALFIVDNSNSDWKALCYLRDYLPLGAIRSIKKRYSDHKLFTANCDVMRQCLF
ncbi:hypothetical protein N9847_00515 [bacterium]|nr:hypothetical protein [bacterium]